MFDDDLRDASQPRRWTIPESDTPWESTESTTTDKGLDGRSVDLETMDESTLGTSKMASGRLDLPDVVHVYPVPAKEMTIDTGQGKLTQADLDSHDFYLVVVKPSAMFSDGTSLVRMGLTLFLYPDDVNTYALLPESQIQSDEILSGKIGVNLGMLLTAGLATQGIVLPDGLIDAKVEFPFKWKTKRAIVRVAGVDTRKAEWEIADEAIDVGFAAHAFVCAHKGAEVVVGARLDGRTRRWFKTADLAPRTDFYRLPTGHRDRDFKPWSQA